MSAEESASAEEPYSEAPQQQEPPPQEPPAAPAQNEDEAMIERIKDLSDLHDQGILTDDQFEEAKNRLID